MKPMLAEDWVEAKVRFPVVAMPKIDGVRGLNLQGGMTGRSLKHHANKYTTNLYSVPELIGFDGELAAEAMNHPDLCRITSSALSTISGEPFTLWHVFDYVTQGTYQMPYLDRLELLAKRVDELQCMLPVGSAASYLRKVPWTLLNNMDELLEYDEANLDAGMEGTIIRAPGAAYKFGRSTVREGGLLRIKRFVESEAVVIEIEEGRTNCNEAQVNELGLQYRTTHAEGMVPNGQVGNMLCTACDDVYDPVDKRKLLIAAGQRIVVSPGCMTAAMRKHYFENQGELLGRVIKFKFFPKGMKDKPRFPTFQSFRIASDIS